MFGYLNFDLSFTNAITFKFLFSEYSEILHKQLSRIVKIPPSTILIPDITSVSCFNENGLELFFIFKMLTPFFELLQKGLCPHILMSLMEISSTKHNREWP